MFWQPSKAWRIKLPKQENANTILAAVLLRKPFIPRLHPRGLVGFNLGDMFLHHGKIPFGEGRIQVLRTVFFFFFLDDKIRLSQRGCQRQCIQRQLQGGWWRNLQFPHEPHCLPNLAGPLSLSLQVLWLLHPFTIILVPFTVNLRQARPACVLGPLQSGCSFLALSEMVFSSLFTHLGLYFLCAKLWSSGWCCYWAPQGHMVFWSFARSPASYYIYAPQ